MSSAMSAGVVARARRALIFQAGAAVLVALGWLLSKGHPEALSSLWGAASSMVLLWLHGVGMRRATDCAAEDPKRSMMIMYVGAGLRFMLLLVLFAIGLGVLGAAALPTVAGFIVTQITGVLAARGGPEPAMRLSSKT
ncbi:MAG: ATP synthase subunit I [Halothiobacillaceae bacterium]|nr:ATP synthase subunit I [Halothiobacillaceae bacterium]